MRKYYFLIALTIAVIFNSNAQVAIKGADVFLSTGAVLYVNDTLIVDDVNSTIINNGQLEANDFLLIQGQLNNNSSGTTIVRDSAEITTTVANDGTFQGGEIYLGAASTFQNNGILQIDQLFRPTAGATFPTSTGAIEFVGNDDNKLLDIGGIYSPLSVRRITFNAANSTRNIILESNIRVTDTADFNSGLVQYSAANDSLVVLSGGLVTMDSAGGNGMMTDVLYRYPGAVGEFMRFPVGDGSPKFRPMWVMSAQYSGAPPKIGVEYLGNKTISDTNAVGYNTTYNTNSWGLYEVEGAFDSSRVQVQYGSGDGVVPVESIIAQGFTVIAGDTVYFNLGQGSNSINAIGGIVESKIPANGDNSVIMIGQSTELRVRVLAYLEGAQNSGGGATFDTDILASGQLASRFEFPGITSQPMLPGKTIPGGPPGAIDSIRLILRDVGNIDIDTTSAWLMSDGSIRDYLTGELNYAVFDNAPNGPQYYVVLDHRNHLKVRSSGLVTPTNTGPGVLVDFTDPTQIFGGGGIKLISPATAMIAGGNSNGDAAINAIDYFQVGNSNNLSETGYINTNVVFNNGNATNVDASDFSKAQQNSSVLYFSTAQ